jgi:lysophospholipid acyltransferase (LPLAT)-like uncharacterized protein
VSSDDNVYEFSSLADYSSWERFKIRIIDIAAYVVMRAIGSTIRFEVEGWENYGSVINNGKLPIWPFWHDRIFLSAVYFKDRGIVVITSKSGDGEYIARFIQRFGFGAIRGSSSRGGARALVEMKRSMLQGREIAFTVDGPRGPRYEAKPGPIYLAKLTGNPILPFLMQPQKYWTLKSWDRLQIPKPFTKALLVIAEPFFINEAEADGGIDSGVVRMQRSLDGLVERGRQWAVDGR